MANGSIDLTTLLPARNRDKTLDGLMRNLFNRHLSKADTVPLFGYTGDQTLLQEGEIHLKESDLERQINQLTPIIYAEHAAEKQIFSWVDLEQKLSVLGVDQKTIGDWFSSESYNFIPPIDLDMFCNFHEYYWIGKWMLMDTTLRPGGFLDVEDYVLPAFTRWGNPTLDPEYYVMGRASTTGAAAPLPPVPNLATWSDWSVSNLWMHKSDAIYFLQNYGSGVIGFEDLIQATRPIVCYLYTVRMNTFRDSLGVPSESGTYVEQVKIKKNQLPLFDLYRYDGSHLGVSSPIFYYQESQDSPIDQVIGRRLVVDENSDFTFEHSLVDVDTGELYFFKEFDTDEVNDYTEFPPPGGGE